jgi:hypothetical protein
MLSRLIFDTSFLLPLQKLVVMAGPKLSLRVQEQSLKPGKVEIKNGYNIGGRGILRLETADGQLRLRV